MASRRAPAGARLAAGLLVFLLVLLVAGGARLAIAQEATAARALLTERMGDAATDLHSAGIAQEATAARALLAERMGEEAGDIHSAGIAQEATAARALLEERMGEEAADLHSARIAEVAKAERAHLPAAARALLAERMGNHRADIQRLQEAVLFLEHEAVQARARSIAAEPRIAPPGPGGAGDLNHLVPARFFELQDELRVRARRLADAAVGADDAAIAKAYGALAETCVRCHAAFLRRR